MYEVEWKVNSVSCLSLESWQLIWDGGIGLNTTGILTLIFYLLALLPFYMAASSDDISVSTAELVEGFLNPAVGGICLHSRLWAG